MITTRVERHIIKPNNPQFKVIDELCFKAKNLYNVSTYYIKNYYKENGKYIGGAKLESYLKEIGNVDYRALPAQCSQQVLKIINKSWESFFKGLKAYNLHPEKFKGRPKEPNFKHKTKGRFVLPFTNQQCSIIGNKVKFPKVINLELSTKIPGDFSDPINKFLERLKPIPYIDNNGKKKNKKIKTNYFGQIYFFPIKDEQNPLLDIPHFINCMFGNYTEMALSFTNLQQLRLIPKGPIYVVELVYNIYAPDKNLDNLKEDKDKRIIAIDMGVNNFATIVNNFGEKPMVIEGQNIKSINQFYNKKKAILMSYVGDRGYSKRLNSLNVKRNCKVDDYIHKSSKMTIDYCIKHDVNMIVIGHNIGWKQNGKMNKENNQKFVCIPFNNYIQQLKYKSEKYGIEVVISEESYTSKASFLDNDLLPKYDEKKSGSYKFSGTRPKRGLYKSKEGILINADVNGGYNILRKVIPEFSSEEGIEGVGLHPFRVNPI